MPHNINLELQEPFTLAPGQVSFFKQNGFIKLKNVFSPETIAYLNETISKEVQRLNTQHLPLAERDTYGKAFLQIMNIWTKSEPVKEIVFSKRLAKIAADLLGVDGVRLYHDQALYKEPGGGITPWHADQYYWPLASDSTVTVWIPLQETPLEMGPLEFSSESFKLTTGRDKEIGDESQQILKETLAREGFEHVVEPFDLGEVSFHKGWLFHRAGANNTDKMRSVMTMIYMDKDMVLKQPENKNQLLDWETWCPGAEVGKQIDTPINPVLYEN
ncbi:phytanoyl-CoA dioxygenase family protein [Ginsengibacter hankyongi]|uniref:Phytanoyl-CoA dioxygenase family protein n=1 Tax=Ginsengibacter hankyongi TaxID=2607284 RepID=A0A5J5IFL2_9BACT|nr:phytanoyl-CoA dioxygenase family protein [Ginsengibacter hankyongi]KAA9038643.1 phytanoyl-CoA dioxygenase family protein [Ginsengibacter hankyongi]